MFFEIPENKLIEELMEKQIKEFKSKIKEMASEIEKEKHKNEDFEAEIKRNSQVIKNNEEKIVLLSTELQRTMNILGFLQTENLSLKENERIYKENERSLISIKTGLEERLKSLCLELEKRENERNFKNTDDEKNFKTAINNALRLLKEEEEKFQVFFEKLQAKDEKIRVLEDKTQFLRNKKGLNEALEVQKSQFKAKFEEISRLYEDSLIRLRGKDEKLNLQEKIIEQIKKNNQENDKKLRSPENKEHDILLKENERLQRLLIDQGNKSIENHKFLLNVEAENLRKLIIDHYNGYLVIVRNNDLQAGLKAEAPISELREKLNSIIKAFNKIIIDYMSSQIVFTETLKEKKASEELLAQKTLEIKEFEAKNQELLAKNLLINAEIMRLSQILKQIEGDFIEKGHEFESKLLLAQTEIENIKSSLKFRNQENESLKKSNEHLMRYSSFESEFLALKRELENSEMKYIEKLKENEVLKRKFIENSDLLSQKTETVKKAVSDKENFKINELEIELKFSKQEIEHLAKIKQEQIVQIGELKAALLELENEKTGFKLNKEESKAKIAILEEEKEKFLNEFIAKNTFDGQISQFKAKIDKLEHEKSLKEYENESLRSSLKGKEKLEEEIERIKEKNVELERELAFYKKKLLEYEDIKKEYEILLEKIEMFEAKNKQISRELQESNEQKKRFEGEIQRKTEEIEGIKGFEVKYRDLFNRQALSVSEIERLHQIIREKNEDNKRFNIEIRDLQKENDQNRENLRNYNELKVIIESLKGENEEINVNMFKLKEENLRNNEKIAKLEEENWAMREKNREIEGFNKENLKKLLEYQKFLEKLEFENEKLKSLMFERLKEIEALKRKISEISNVFEENANSAKEKFEDIVTNFLVSFYYRKASIFKAFFYQKEEKNQTFLDRNRNLLENRNLAEEGLKFNGKAEKTEKTEKKVAKKRTKSYLFENENVKSPIFSLILRNY